MRALVVDDEPLARRRLVRMLEGIGDVEVVGEACDGQDALDQIGKLIPDVVFLDIRMPGLDGLELASRHRLPPIVFTTAYHEYAVQAFEAEAVDYLLKPIEPERLRVAMERVRRRSPAELAGRLDSVVRCLSAPQPRPRISARSGSSLFLFDPREIARFRAESKYVTFQHKGKPYLLEESITSLEQRLANWGFFRPHRAELVNQRHVTALHVEGSSAVLGMSNGDRVPVSRRRLAEVKRTLGLDPPSP